MAIPLSQYDKAMIKSPHFIGWARDLKRLPQYVRHVPQLHEYPSYGLNFTKQRNTSITCTHCGGARKQIVAHQNGAAVEEYCPICFDSKANKSYGVIERNGI